MKTYRFKTEEEFEQEFGPEWRDDVPRAWPSQMDSLFGTEIPTEYNDKILEGFRIVKTGKNHTWAIGPEMIKEIDAKKPKIKYKTEPMFNLRFMED